MKCTKCGMEVNESVSFCPTCGNKLSENRESNINVKSQKIMQNSTFTKFSYSKIHIVLYSIMVVLLFLLYFLVSFMLRLMAEAKVRIGVSSRQYITFNDAFEGVFTFMTIAILIGVIVLVINCVVIHKLCLCIYNDKIVGVSAKNMWFATEDFEVKYSDIININQKANLIIIETGTKKYMCMIQDAKKAYDMIKNAMG